MRISELCDTLSSGLYYVKPRDNETISSASPLVIPRDKKASLMCTPNATQHRGEHGVCAQD